MTEAKYRELLNSIDRIVNDAASIKKKIILEFRPAPGEKSERALEDIFRISKESVGMWDSVSAVDEIKQQRGKE